MGQGYQGRGKEETGRGTVRGQREDRLWEGLSSSLAVRPRKRHALYNDNFRTINQSASPTRVGVVTILHPLCT